MKTLLALAVAASVCATVQAQAQKLDLSTIKCKEFVTTDKETISLILMWLAGYYSGTNAPPIVDFDKMAVDGRRLGEYCGKNPEQGLITAADAVLDN